MGSRAGAKVTVPTLKESILLTIPAGSQAGQRLRIKGKGLVSKTHTGDLFAVIKSLCRQNQMKKRVSSGSSSPKAKPASIRVRHGGKPDG
ncbi:dnaJ C terminal domain protein [Klebsiella aerogenes]|nr:dnaJ C terminal domain protein [Klebsiella aerogenes]